MVHWQECSVHTFAVKKQKGLINLYWNLIAQCLTVFIGNHRAYIEKDILIKKYITVQFFGWAGISVIAKPNAREWSFVKQTIEAE